MAREEYTFKTAPDGGEIKADVHYAAGGSAGKRPVALAIHGGGWIVGNKEQIPQSQITTLNELGFVVVTTNYRLAPQIKVLEGAYEDVKDVYLWIQEKLPQILSRKGVEIDADRIVTIGSSAGGALAHSLVTLPKPPKAILDFYGAKYLNEPEFDEPAPALAQFPAFPEELLAQVWKESPVPSSSDVTPPAGADKGGPPFDFSIPRNAYLFHAIKNGLHLKEAIGVGQYAKADPVTNFAKGYPPVYILHGDADHLVDIKFAKRAYDDLKKLGVEVELDVVPGQPHGFDERLTVEDPLFAHVRKGLEFLKKHATA